jgi:hypothetical protein
MKFSRSEPPHGTIIDDGHALLRTITLRRGIDAAFDSHYYLRQPLLILSID